MLVAIGLAHYDSKALNCDTSNAVIGMNNYFTKSKTNNMGECLRSMVYNLSR